MEQTARRLLVGSIVGALLWVAGCGGGGDGAARHGRLTATVEFPEREAPADVSGQVIPEGANVVLVEVWDPAGQLLGSVALWRAEPVPPKGVVGPSQVIVQPAERVSGTISDLPVGPVVVEANAFPFLDRSLGTRPAAPTPLAGASTPFEIEPGENYLEMTLESRVVTVEVAPPSATVNEFESEQFHATAWDGDGQILIGATFDWSSSDTGVASVAPVDPSSAWATGVSIGTADIVATERASGVSGQAHLTVAAG